MNFPKSRMLAISISLAIVAVLALVVYMFAYLPVQERPSPEETKISQEEPREVKSSESFPLVLEISKISESRVELKITNNANRMLSNVYLYVDGVLKTGGPIASPLAAGHTTAIDFELTGTHKFFANSSEGFKSEVVEYP